LQRENCYTARLSPSVVGDVIELGVVPDSPTTGPLRIYTKGYIFDAVIMRNAVFILGWRKRKRGPD